MPGFIEKLENAIERNHSLLCVGLDPEASRFRPSPPDPQTLLRWSLNLIEQTADVACCYKPNIAFYEQYGPEGLEALRQAIAAVPNGLPVLLDAKRGDIGSTAAAYARAAFEVWKADAITASPYLGQDSIKPFLAYAGKMVFVLCQTSNPSAVEVQNFGSEPLYRHIARLGQQWGDARQVGFVVGATQPQALAQVRALAPDRWLLAPGVGAQGGDLDQALAAGLDANGRGLLVPVSRAIYAPDPRQAALDWRDAINRARSARHKPTPSPAADSLILQLYESNCIRFGSFVLASGKSSPIYVDLRRIVSYPALLRQAIQACADLIRPLTFDCLAAVPYAALPTAAGLALGLNRPMIYPRKEVKTHGTGQAIEGAFEAGQTALVVEDVVTTGGSILAAIETLEQARLIVRDVAVLVDREQGGRAALAEQGYQLHAVLTIRQIMDTLRAQNRIAPEMYQAVKAYLET